jgi:hypothetical protein
MQIMTDKKISFLGFNGKFPLLISNLVYGEPYTSIFINLHLPSLIRELKNCKHNLDIKYLLFTDNHSLEIIKHSQNFKILSDFVPCVVTLIEGEKDYSTRYTLQGLQLNHTVKHALQEKRVVHQITADVYYGMGYFNKAISKFLDDDSDAIFFENFRCAYESLAPHLYNRDTPDTMQLHALAISNLHPLWVAAHWEAPFFSRLPYTMIWGGGNQLISRGFSQSVPFFKPFDWMLSSGGCNDINISTRVDKVSFIRSWHEAPSIELGMLSTFYPAFTTSPSNTRVVANWAKNIASLPKKSLENLNRYTVFSAPGEGINEEIVQVSQRIVNEIAKSYNEISDANDN